MTNPDMNTALLMCLSCFLSYLKLYLSSVVFIAFVLRKGMALEELYSGLIGEVSHLVSFLMKVLQTIRISSLSDNPEYSA